MAKGNTCPNCGKQTFGKKKAVRICSSCKVVGWFEKPGGTGGGKGKTCGSCDESTLHMIHQSSRFTVRGCSNLYCQAIIISK
jgi:hypothetical protein